jgi:WD40 repeat protein
MKSKTFKIFWIGLAITVMLACGIRPRATSTPARPAETAAAETPTGTSVAQELDTVEPTADTSSVVITPAVPEATATEAAPAVFENTPTGAVPLGIPSTNSQGTISPNAIGFENRNQIHKVQEFQQQGPVYVVAFSPDDRTLVSGGDDKIVHVWDIEKGSEAASLQGHTGSIKDISFSADGKQMASISRSEIIVWDTATWKSITTLPIKGTGLGVKFLPDNSLLSISVAGEIRIWDVASGQPGSLEMIPRYSAASCAGASVYSFDTNADGSVLAAALSCGSSVIWKRGAGEVLFGDLNRYKDTQSGKPPLASTITLAPDGKQAAYGAVYYPSYGLMLLDVIDVDNKKVIGSVSPMDPDLFTAKIGAKDDLVVAGVANTIYGWWPGAYSWSDKDLIQLTEHKGRVMALEFSNAGEMLASGDYGGRILVWNGK